MKQNSHIKTFLKNWPTRQDFARDLSAVLAARQVDAVGVERVHKWARTGSIPAPFWSAIIATAQARGLELTAEQLAQWHEVKPALASAAA